MTETVEYFLCGVISAAALVFFISLLLYGLSWKPKQNDQTSGMVDNFDKGTEHGPNQANTTSLTCPTVQRLIKIAYELTTIKEDYRKWLSELATRDYSFTVADCNKSEELSLRLTAVAKMYSNLMTEQRGAQ